MKQFIRQDVSYIYIRQLQGGMSVEWQNKNNAKGTSFRLVQYNLSIFKIGTPLAAHSSEQNATKIHGISCRIKTHTHIYFLRHDPIILNRRTLHKFGVSHFYVNLPKNNCETVKYVMEAPSSIFEIGLS